MRRTITTVAATATVIAAIKVTKEAKLFLVNAAGNYRLYRLMREADAARLAADARWDEVHPVFVSPDDEDLIGDVLTQP